MSGVGNLVENIRQTVEEQPDATAMAFDDRTWTYRELWEATGRFADGLASRGLGADTRVALYLPNLPAFVTAFHGTLRNGGVVVPMNPQYRSREIEHLLTDSAASVVVTITDLVPVVEAVRDATKVQEIVTVDGDADGATTFEAFLGEPEAPVATRDGDQLAVLPYTSGTTGTPKGVRLTHQNLAGNADQIVRAIPGGIQPDDKMLGVLPLFHIYGMNVVMNATLFGGGTYHPLPTWDVEQATGLIDEAELTIMHGVPAMYNDVITHEDAETFDLSSLRMGGVGGAGIPREVLETFEALYDVELYEGYGLTETSPVTHFNSPNWGRRVGSIGKTLPGVDAKIVDADLEEIDPVEEGPVDEDAVDLDEITGEILITGPNVMDGYFGLPEANEEAFVELEGTRWLRTGDVGYHDADGFYYVVDRKTHMILSKGYNVYPREIEELLFEHPGIASAAVVGVPDDEHGELVKAYVVPAPGSDLTPKEIQAYCLENLAPYKHPREVELVEELPRTTTGKVKKHHLVDETQGS